MRDTLRALIPEDLLNWYRSFKKNKVRKGLEKQRAKGKVLSKTELVSQLKVIGIEEGDSLMVHCAMSKMGYLENGPSTFIESLKEAVGPKGNILMPSSPVDKLQLDYISENRTFDVLNTPSKMGSVSETFRKMDHVIRSTHPTEPVCAFGPDAEHFTNGHFGKETPYGETSPWHRLMEKKGKILYVGVTLINAGTHLHVLEDLTDFKYPVYSDQTFDIEVINHLGLTQNVKTKVHNPEFSKRRKCDELIPQFKEDNVLKEVRLGQAQCLLLDANVMLSSMLKAYKNKGVTMYTPHGEKIEGYD